VFQRLLLVEHTGAMGVIGGGRRWPHDDLRSLGCLAGERGAGNGRARRRWQLELTGCGSRVSDLLVGPRWPEQDAQSPILPHPSRHRDCGIRLAGKRALLLYHRTHRRANGKLGTESGDKLRGRLCEQSQRVSGPATTSRPRSSRWPSMGRRSRGRIGLRWSCIRDAAASKMRAASAPASLLRMQQFPFCYEE